MKKRVRQQAIDTAARILARAKDMPMDRAIGFEDGYVRGFCDGHRSGCGSLGGRPKKKP